jgi:hypothetical protein
MERAKISGSITDVDGAPAIAERRQHPARGIATVIDVSGTGGVADAEAVEAMKSTLSTAPRMGGSCRGSQRHGAEGSCGDKSKNKFAKHGHSP